MGIKLSQYFIQHTIERNNICIIHKNCNIFFYLDLFGLCFVVGRKIVNKELKLQNNKLVPCYDDYKRQTICFNYCLSLAHHLPNCQPYYNNIYQDNYTSQQFQIKKLWLVFSKALEHLMLVSHVDGFFLQCCRYVSI